MALVFAGTIVVTVAAVLWWRDARHYEATDDAYVDVASEQVSPQVAGRVVRVLVNDNQDVAAGQVLVELDPATYENRQKQAQAAVAQARAQVAQTRAQRQIGTVEVERARASLGVAEATLANARSDLQRFRQEDNANHDTVTAQQMQHAVQDERSATAQLDVARQAVAVASAQLEASDTAIAAAQAGVRSAEVQAGQAALELAYTRVHATMAGRVAHKTVAPGDYVEPGTAMMAIVPGDVYVTANFKETQLALMRPGQPAQIRVDAYPNLKLTGHVDSVQPASGQQFSEIPAQNATGNWVKVVQRVPVKIVLDRVPADPERLGPGISVTVQVTVR